MRIIKKFKKKRLEKLSFKISKQKKCAILYKNQLVQKVEADKMEIDSFVSECDAKLEIINKLTDDLKDVEYIPSVEKKFSIKESPLEVYVGDTWKGLEVSTGGIKGFKL